MPSLSTNYEGLASPGPLKPEALLPRHPLDTAGLFSKATFSWANKLIALGNTKQLNPDDVWKIQEKNSVEPILASTVDVYEACDRKLLKTFFTIYWPRLVLVGVMQLASAGCDLFGPSYVIKQILKATAPLPGEDIDWTRAILLCVALYGVQIFSTFMRSHIHFINDVIGIQYTAFMRSILFKKALNLSAASRKEKSAGDVANLFSVDVVNFMFFSVNLNMLWIVPVQIAVTLYLIHSEVGWAIYIGFAALVLVLLITMVFGVFIGRASNRILTAKDNRMKVINELFGAVQIVKFNAWEEKFEARIVELRNKELAAILVFIKNLLVIITSMYTAPVLITVVVFATYSIWMNQVLTPSIVFTTLALFKSLQESLVALPSTFVQMIEAVISARRIAAVLAMDEFVPENVTHADVHHIELAKEFAHDETMVAITNGSFGWDADKPLFKNLNWKIHRGEFVVVHGGVGSGKSSLCSILLGEMDKYEGSVFVGGRVAYFAQQSWIQNATIRENILFAKPYDAVKYRKVLDACALTKDMDSFPAGDRTEIGLKGVNLSGGQKARVSLARACYSDADIFVFDAPLSALDAIVANEVFQKCFLGLLKDKTVILVTHNPDVIESPAIDRSFLIKDGELMESTIDKPRARNTPLVSPLKARRGYWDDVDEETWTLPQEKLIRKHDLLITPSASTPYGFQDAPLIFTPRRVSVTANVTAQENLIVEEERAKGRVSKDVAFAYLKAVGGWFAMFVMVFWTVATEGVRVSSDMWLSHWSNSAGSLTNEKFRADSNKNMGTYSALILAVSALTVLQVYVVLMYGLRGSKKLFADMLNGMVQAPMRFFDTNPIGRILNRFGDDVFQCDIQLPLSFAPILCETAMALSKLITSIAIIQWMGLLIPPLIYGYFKLGQYFLAPLREMNRIKKVSMSPLLSLVSEGIDGTVVIRSFGDKYQRRFVRVHDHDINNYSGTMFCFAALNQWFGLRVQFVSNSIVFAIALGAVIMSSKLSAGIIGLAFTYGLNIPANLANLVNMWASLETSLIAPERLHEYASVPHEGERETKLELKEQLSAWPTQGRVEFDKVSFRYKPDDPLVLKNVSFNVRGGEKIGVVGRTGAGKSSLMMALFRINDVAEGAILIDGIDSATVGLRQLRSSLAIIPQNPVLFKGTLRNYMDPFEEFSDDQLWTVLKKIVEENGENFSVGERQMLCMSRALLHQAKVVILDEATAAIDHETDQLLQKVIREEFAPSTVLTIAHRLDTVLDYDRIMVLDQGELVQCDTPEALIGQGNGIFYEMIVEGGYADRLNKDV
ncbi:Aste57867_19276 [Aphanomyces stellatus]|uniref:Aste57867_19276 protein n=1 Tax=Aphanomyces stellatus TaxID=120398 RepID=A0A485LGF7_9STRA|nr:hypothetical protein As57867_019212 [Aphanomyces stellatus]VFT95996.1 Aste57867_19276 [Aphanomyces stellatus]